MTGYRTELLIHLMSEITRLHNYRLYMQNSGKYFYAITEDFIFATEQSTILKRRMYALVYGAKV